MVDIVEISAMVAAAGVIVGVVYYILDMRHNMKAREMETCRLVVSDYISEQAIKRHATMMNMEWKDNKDFIERYGNSNPEMFAIWASWFFAWEMMGILLKNKIVRAEEMYDLGGYTAMLAWEKFKDVIQGFRSFRGSRWTPPDLLSNAEFFSQEMLKVKTQREAGFKDKPKTTLNTSTRK